jgi:hypothetical protein
MVTIPAVRAAFGLERNLHLREVGSETAEHILDHMVRSNAKDLISNFRVQMAVSQMPSQAG